MRAHGGGGVYGIRAAPFFKALCVRYGEFLAEDNEDTWQIHGIDLLLT